MACIAGHFHLTATMESTIQLSFQLADQDQKDLLIAQLSDLGFDAFEETETGLEAYIAADNFDENAVKELFSILESISSYETNKSGVAVALNKYFFMNQINYLVDQQGITKLLKFRNNFQYLFDSFKQKIVSV